MISPEMGPIVAAIGALALAVIGLLAKVIRDSMHNRNGNEPVSSKEFEAFTEQQEKRHEEYRAEFGKVRDRIDKVDDALTAEDGRLRDHYHKLSQTVTNVAGEPRVLAVKFEALERRLGTLEAGFDAFRTFMQSGQVTIIESLQRLERQRREP